MEDSYLDCTNEKDKENDFYFDMFCENILDHVPKQDYTYVEEQLEEMYDDFMRYLNYITEKYYRNGFVDGVQLVMGCLEE